MEINRVTTEKKNFEPLQHLPRLQTEKHIEVGKKDVVTFAFHHNIVTRKDKVGAILSNYSHGIAAKNIILKELQTIVQLFSQIGTMLESEQYSEQMAKHILNHVQEIMKQAHMRDIPLLDGTYDFLIATHKGKEATLALLDMNQLLYMLERDPTEVHRIITAITVYMKGLTNDDTWIEESSVVRQEKDVTMWRALAEMSMTQIMQKWKETEQESKWSIALFVLLIWIIFICFPNFLSRINGL